MASFFMLNNLKTGISTVVFSFLKELFCSYNDKVMENRKEK
ncbi:hypothetical protein [Flavobacterium notoginsengisoli]